MFLHSTVGLAIVLALSQAAVPQRRPPERGVDSVTVDFAAVSPKGQAITDLTAGEISVRIGGRTRAVRSLQRIEVEENEGAAAPEPLPPPFGTNGVSESGRTLLLIVDDDSFRIGREVPLR